MTFDIKNYDITYSSLNEQCRAYRPEGMLEHISKDKKQSTSQIEGKSVLKL